MSDEPDFIAAGAATTAERRTALIDAISRTPDRDDRGSDARRRLEQLLTPDELAALDKRVLATVTAALEAQGDPPAFFDAFGTAHAARKRTLIDAVRGREPDPDPSTLRAGGSFDGGARDSPPRQPPSHDEWLGAALRSGSLNAGRHF
jgi:hypothetical protein